MTLGLAITLIAITIAWIVFEVLYLFEKDSKKYVIVTRPPKDYVTTQFILLTCKYFRSKSKAVCYAYEHDFENWMILELFAEKYHE